MPCFQTDLGFPRATQVINREELVACKKDAILSIAEQIISAVSGNNWPEGTHQDVKIRDCRALMHQPSLFDLYKYRNEPHVLRPFQTYRIFDKDVLEGGSGGNRTFPSHLVVECEQVIVKCQNDCTDP